VLRPTVLRATALRSQSYLTAFETLQRRVNNIYRSAPEDDWQTLDLVQRGVDMVVDSSSPYRPLSEAERMADDIHRALDNHTQIVSVVIRRDALRNELTKILARYDQD